MDKTDWIVYGVIVLAALYIIRSVVFRKGKKGCCAKSCAAPEKTPAEKPVSTEDKNSISCHKKTTA